MVYKDKNCLKCEIKYSPNSSNQKYCSDCKEKAYKEYKHNWYENHPNYHQEIYQKNKERLLKQSKEWYLKNREKSLKRKKKWRENNPNYMKKYYQEKKGEIKRKVKKWAKKNKEKVLTQKREYYQRNKKVYQAHNRKYYRNNKERIYKNSKIYRRNRYKINKNYNILKKLRALFNQALKYYTKTGKIMTSKQYGVNYKEIIEYLEPFPKDYLTSKNKYHTHHIKPLYTFNFVNKDGSTNLKEVKKAFAPENHQLLTKEEHKEIHRVTLLKLH